MENGASGVAGAALARRIVRPWELLGLGCFFGWFFLVRQQLQAQGAAELADFADNRVVFELLLAACFALGTLLWRAAEGKTRELVLGGVGAAGSAFALVVVQLETVTVRPLALVALLVACLAMSQLTILCCRHLIVDSSTRMTSHVLVSILAARLLALLPAMETPWPAFAVSVLLPAGFGALVRRLGPSLPEVDSGRQRGLGAGRLALAACSLFLLGLGYGVFKQIVAADPSYMPPIPVLNLFILAFHVVAASLILTLGRRAVFVNAYLGTMFALCLGCACVTLQPQAAHCLGASLVLWSQFVLMGLVWIVAPTLTIRVHGRQTTLFGWCFAVFFTSSALGGLIGGATIGSGGQVLQPASTATALLIVALVVHFFLLRETDLRTLVLSHEDVHQASEVALAERCARVAELKGLSDRELDVLLLWLKGTSAAELASNLCVSESTVRSHVRHIYAKTGAHNREELAELVRNL